MIPCEAFPAEGDILLNAGLTVVTLMVANTGDRPVQVGSRYHFAETNTGLAFDRELSLGMRLYIAAGTTVRFEPGQTREVRLLPYMVQPRSNWCAVTQIGDVDETLWNPV